MSEMGRRPLTGVVQQPMRAMDELARLIHNAHIELCSDFDCPCSLELAWEAAQELFLQLKIENGDA